MEFRDVEGLPGYRVSDTGVVIGIKGKELSLHPDATGYPRIYPPNTGAKRVHRLVAMAFLPNPNNYAEVNHIDGVKTNNNVCNLEWTDRLGNMRHAYRTGLSPQLGSGENGLRAILTQKQVDYIRAHCVKRDKEFSQTALARKFGVSISTINYIVSGKIWRG
jgi:hypothetical protein